LVFFAPPHSPRSSWPDKQHSLRKKLILGVSVMPLVAAVAIVYVLHFM